MQTRVHWGWGLAGRAFGAALLWPVILLARPAQASLTVLVGEPFASFGTMMPNGHSTIYLNRVCADGPFRLRMCQPGEAPGVAIARYDRIGRHDWIATPILEFLYAADKPDEALTYAMPKTVTVMREAYRERFLREMFPEGAKTKGTQEWWESAGMAYMRRLWGYRIATTQAQDEQFVATMNARPNQRAYRVWKANCADFSAELVNLYFPGVVKRDRVADFDVMSPKQVARSVYRYGMAHPEAELKVIEIPQVPGSLRRSKPVRGGAEGFLKTKRYVVALSVLQPELVLAALVMYLDEGRWAVARAAEVETPETIGAPTEVPMANR